jgi:hypothetical protein
MDVAFATYEIGGQKQMLRYFKTLPGLACESLLLVLALSSTAHARTNLSPRWLSQYQLAGASIAAPNSSFLSDTRSEALRSEFNEELKSLVIDNGQAAAWHEQYLAMNRDYEMRQRAGIVSSYNDQVHTGAMAGFSNGVFQEMQKHVQSEAGMRAERVAKKSDVIVVASAPAVVAAGIYIGRPIRVKVADDTRLALSTDFRGHTGSLEFTSPSLYGALQFRPLAAASRDYNPGAGVDFGKMMEMQRAVDFSEERYQLTVQRSLPIFNLSSAVLYGSSSNAEAGSLSKQLTDHITCIVDEVRMLNGGEVARGVSEEKFRLRYDIRF